MANQYEIVYRLSNCGIFNDLERVLTKISRSHHYMTLNISESVPDTYIVSYIEWNTNRDTHALQLL